MAGEPVVDEFMLEARAINTRDLLVCKMVWEADALLGCF